MPWPARRSRTPTGSNRTGCSWERDLADFRPQVDFANFPDANSAIGDPTPACNRDCFEMRHDAPQKDQDRPWTGFVQTKSR